MNNTASSIVARHYQTMQPVRITLSDGRIASILPAFGADVDRTSLPIVSPGLFDLQVNGFAGIWFNSDSLTVNDVESVIHAYLQHGITRCLPTLITSSCEAIEHGLATIQQAREKSAVVRQAVVGYHIEGPFISPVDGPRGAHPLAHVRPADLMELSRWQRAAGGLVKLITLAPEVPGAMQFIRVASRSCTIAIGHSAAGAREIAEAIDAGAKLGTHLGNGCAGMVPRHDNVFWPQLADDRLACSVIADGWHVPSTMLKSIVRCKSMDRTILTCDVSGFGGCAPGRYSAGEIDVDVLDDGRIVVAGQTQFLAGSGATTGDCVVHMMQTCDVSLSDALLSASIRPANLLGLSAHDIIEGAPAFLTVFRIEPNQAGQLRFIPVKSVCGEHAFEAKA